MEPAINYMPSAFYYRQALRTARTREDAIAVGLHVVAEVEQLKQWVRKQGLVPPKWHLMRSEVAAKHWGEVVPWQSSEQS